MANDLIKQRLRIVHILGVTALVVLLGASAYVCFRMYQDGAQHIKDADALNREIQSYAAVDKTNAELQADQKEAEKRLAQVESRLPAGPQQDEFFKEISKVMNDAGVTLIERNTDKPVEVDGGYMALPVYVKGVGTWEGVYSLLNGLRSMRRITRLDNVSIETTPEAVRANPAEPLRDFTIRFSTFYKGK